MAKCKKCFFPNRADATVCVKCGTPLFDEVNVNTEILDSSTQLNSTVLESANEIPCRKTVMETGGVSGTVILSDETEVKSFDLSVDTAAPVASGVSVETTPPVISEVASAASATEGVHCCPECGYYVRKDALACPKCGKELASSLSFVSTASPVSQEAEPEVSSTKYNVTGTVPVFTLDVQSTANPTGTILPGELRRKEPSFSLTALGGYGIEGDKLKFIGEEVVLNRQNLDAQNMTITSKQQARIMCIEGHWYVIDESTFKTTFVQVARETELRDGDIILFGDKKFKFSKE